MDDRRAVFEEMVRAASLSEAPVDPLTQEILNACARDVLEAAGVPALLDEREQLLELAAAARVLVLETVCLSEPPCGACAPCAFRAALAKLGGAEDA